MRSSRILLADAAINLVMGALLATFPRTVVEALGVPDTDTTFYPSILGAVLIGIGVALVIEYVRRPTGPTGLGLYGAIAINLCGATFLIGWLLSGKLEIPFRGQAFLWALAVVLIAISLVELVSVRRIVRCVKRRRAANAQGNSRATPRSARPSKSRSATGIPRSILASPRNRTARPRTVSTTNDQGKPCAELESSPKSFYCLAS